MSSLGQKLKKKYINLIIIFLIPQPTQLHSHHREVWPAVERADTAGGSLALSCCHLFYRTLPRNKQEKWWLWSIYFKDNINNICLFHAKSLIHWWWEWTLELQRVPLPRANPNNIRHQQETGRRYRSCHIHFEKLHCISNFLCFLEKEIGVPP